jgi:hypothetical protein
LYTVCLSATVPVPVLVPVTVPVLFLCAV